MNKPQRPQHGHYTLAAPLAGYRPGVVLTIDYSAKPLAGAITVLGLDTEHEHLARYEGQPDAAGRACQLSIEGDELEAVCPHCAAPALCYDLCPHCGGHYSQPPTEANGRAVHG